MRCIRFPFAAALLVASACSTETETQAGTSSTSGLESSAESASESASSADEARPDRATLSPTRLETCTPDSALLAGAPAVEVTIGRTLGECSVEQPAQLAEGETPSLDLTVLGGPGLAAEVTSCANGGAPSVDFSSKSYATFTSTHRVSEDWRVAFAVDDGERVHVGLRLERNCAAATATTATETLAIEMAGRGRSIVVHRCEPRSEPRAQPPVCN